MVCKKQGSIWLSFLQTVEHSFTYFGFEAKTNVSNVIKKMRSDKCLPIIRTLDIQYHVDMLEI